MTRYAVPIASFEGLKSRVNDHFAMSEDFVILEAEGDKILDVRSIHNEQADEKKAADFLIDNGVEVVLCGRIGTCMMRILQDQGVAIYSGAEGTVREAFKDHRAGKLTEVRPNPYQI